MRHYEYTFMTIGVVALSALLPRSAFAQTDAEATPPSEPAAAPTTAAPTAQEASADISPATQKKLDEQSAKIEELTKTVKALSEKSARIDELENTVSSMSQDSATESAEDSEHKLEIWGFFDVTLGRAFLDNPHGLVGARYPTNWSFMSNGINIYLKRELSDTVSAMVETRLTYSPVGVVYQYPTNAYVNNQFNQHQLKLIRGGEASYGPYDAATYRQHGLVIERAHFDWKPKSWFGIRVGRYLTPFGIWNEDHGSPVILAVQRPSLIQYQLVPTHQQGIMIYGNRYLASNLELEYSATLSNGRGPVDEFMDLDNNKALGLRSKLTYTAPDLMIRVGGYGYYGRYTNSEPTYDVWLTSGYTIDHNHPASYGSTNVVLESYRESTVTLDAMLQLYGLRVVAEYARRKVVYTTAPKLSAIDTFLNDVPPVGLDAYAANYIGKAYYGLVGYEFPLGPSLADIKVTPYVGADYIAPDKTKPYLESRQYRLGVNAKLSPNVTTKAEINRSNPKSVEMASDCWFFYAQAAVSF